MGKEMRNKYKQHCVSVAGFEKKKKIGWKLILGEGERAREKRVKCNKKS